MQGSESGNGNSWSDDQLGSNAKSRLMKSESYPPPGSKRRGGYKPSMLKGKEIEVWVSVNSGTEESCRIVRTKLEQLRSTSSLNESSADKYSRLLGSSSGKEKMLQSCKSLKVKKELDIPFLPLRRIRSVSSAESINLHQVESPRSSFTHHYRLTVPEKSSGMNTASLVEEKAVESDGRREKIVSIDDAFDLNLDGIAEKVSEELIVLDMSDSCRGEEDFINLFPTDMNSNSDTCFQKEVSASAGNLLVFFLRFKLNNF